MKRRDFQIEVKHEFTLREKFLEREMESKRIDKLRSLLMRKRAEVSERGDEKVALQIQTIARGFTV